MLDRWLACEHGMPTSRVPQLSIQLEVLGSTSRSSLFAARTSGRLGNAAMRIALVVLGFGNPTLDDALPHQRQRFWMSRRCKAAPWQHCMYICCKLGLRCLIFKRSINSQPSTLVNLIHRVLYWKKVMKQLNVCGGCRFADLYDTYENNSNWFHLSQSSGWTFDKKVWETTTMYPNWRGLEEVSQISLLETPPKKTERKNAGHSRKGSPFQPWTVCRCIWRLDNRNFGTIYYRWNPEICVPTRNKSLLPFLRFVHYLKVQTTKSIDFYLEYGCFQKQWYLQNIHFTRVFHYKPSILAENHLFLEISIFHQQKWILKVFSSLEPWTAMFFNGWKWWSPPIFH